MKPLLCGMGTSSLPPCPDGNGWEPKRQRYIRVGGSAIGRGSDVQVCINGFDGPQQERVRMKSAAGSCAELPDFAGNAAASCIAVLQFECPLDGVRQQRRRLVEKRCILRAK